MKTFLFCLLSFLFTSAFAQFERTFVQAEIQFKNGENLRGYIFDDFVQNDWYGKADHTKSIGMSANSSMGSYPTSSSTFQTIIKTIHYKVNANDGQQTDYSSDSIHYIITTQPKGKVTKYKTFQLIRANPMDDINVKFDTLNRIMWSPVRKEGKINMYGYFNWLGKKKNSWSDVYFQKEGEQYGVQILLTHKIIWGIESHRPFVKAALLKVFGDCSEFTQNIETIIDQYIEDFKTTRSGLNDEQKKQIKALPKDQRDRKEFEIREERSYLPYDNLLKTYYNYCGE